MAITFMNISEAQCAVIYKEVVLNAKRHQRVAEILAREEEYPNSIAHLILSTEELLKGLVLLLESKGMRLREIEGFKKVFSNHKSRHYLLRDLIPVWLVVKKIYDELHKPTATSRLKPGAPKWLKILVNATSVIQEGLIGYTQYKFWGDADELKQKAFYVDFQDELSSPAAVTLDFFRIVNCQVERVAKEVNDFMEELITASPEDSKKFMDRAKDEDFRELLAGTISGKHSLFSPKLKS